mmetsp:Transcript_5029/g.5478  ORF Transcript_5029/g.5478 Transcript_5029/m.5478 type:complete len:299 (+) Transcript_5029:180-1076(+)
MFTITHLLHATIVLFTLFYTIRSACDCQCDICDACDFTDPACTVITSGAPGEITVAGCLIIDTTEQIGSIRGTSGNDCVRLNPGSVVMGEISLLPGDDCVQVTSSTIMGRIQSGGDNDCIVVVSSNVDEVNGGPGNDDVIVVASNTDGAIEGTFNRIVGGGGDDCLRVAGTEAGEISGQTNDDCLFVTQTIATRILGGNDNDNMDLRQVTFDEASGNEGNDELRINEFTTTSGPLSIRGGPGDDFILAVRSQGDPTTFDGDGGSDLCCSPDMTVEIAADSMCDPTECDLPGPVCVRRF